MLLEEALPALRAGHKVKRDEWPLGQYVVMQPGYPTGIGINSNTARATGLPEGTMRIFRPYLMVQRPDLSFVPYELSHDDLFGADWRDVDAQISAAVQEATEPAAASALAELAQHDPGTGVEHAA